MDVTEAEKVRKDVDGLHLALVLIADYQRDCRTLCVRDDEEAAIAIQIIRGLGYTVARRSLPCSGNIRSQEIFISLGTVQGG